MDFADTYRTVLLYGPIKPIAAVRRFTVLFKGRYLYKGVVFEETNRIPV